MGETSIALLIAIVGVTAGLVKLVDFLVHRYFTKEDEDTSIHAERTNELLSEFKLNMKELRDVSDKIHQVCKDTFDMHNVRDPETGAYIWYAPYQREVLDTVKEMSKTLERTVAIVDTIERRSVPPDKK